MVDWGGGVGGNSTRTEHDWGIAVTLSTNSIVTLSGRATGARIGANLDGLGGVGQGTTDGDGVVDRASVGIVSGETAILVTAGLGLTGITAGASAGAHGATIDLLTGGVFVGDFSVGEDTIINPHLVKCAAPEVVDITAPDVGCSVFDYISGHGLGIIKDTV